MQNLRINPNIEASARADELSLFRGGPLYRLQVSLHLIKAHQWNLARRVTWLLAITWLPLVIVTALLHPEELSGLLRDYLVYSRVVIALPVLLIGQLLMEARFRVVVEQVREAQLVRDEDQHKLDTVIAMLRRLRDSALPETLIAVLVITELVIIGPGRLINGPAWAASRGAGAAHPTAAGWYYLLVGVLIYQFLVLLGFWKWSVWSYFLYKLSRMDLRLVATHPDLHGGLGFLGLAPVAFIPIAVAISIAIGAAWRYEILHTAASLDSYLVSAIALVALIFVFELAPLCFFLWKLSVLRQKAILEYGVLAQVHSTEFHKKWISRREDRGQEPSEDPNVTMLADFDIIYNNIKRMQPLPVDRNTLIGLALAVLVPLLPVVLAEISLRVILNELISAVRAATI
jgi:hypothetical protein